MPFKKIFILSFILIFFFCSKINKELWERKIYAFSILNPRDTLIKVFVDSNYSIKEKIKNIGIEDGQVFVINEDKKETLFLSYEKEGLYKKVSSSFVKPLNTYSLFVIFEKDTLTKKTKVPDTFSIIFPQNNDTIDYDSLIYFNWHKSKGALAYALFVFKLPLDTAFEYFPLITKDTFLNIKEIKEALFDTTAYYLLKVYAWDYNRYKWAVKRGGLDTLYHGFGHFSSQTADERIIYIKFSSSKYP